MINDTCLKTIVNKATVARLATVDLECKPHLIPVVFAFDNDCYFIPIDEKTRGGYP
jgi:nitroimidazol reductase NimA-like FMN-containing flavoprotein (pyridoxamine 5'-phosphate oxidase superfamily)